MPFARPVATSRNAAFWSGNDIEAKPKQKADRADETTRPGAYFVPQVDIFETSDELRILADMPGVPPDAVQVHLEGDELTIEGRVRADDYQGLKPLHVEYGSWAVQKGNNALVKFVNSFICKEQSSGKLASIYKATEGTSLPPMPSC